MRQRSRGAALKREVARMWCEKIGRGGQSRPSRIIALAR